MTTETWQLHGTADLVQDSAGLFSTEQRQWHTLVRITPIRLHIPPGSGPANYAETIDFDG